MFPRASTLTLTVPPDTSPRARRTSGVTSVPASNTRARESRLTTAYATRNGLWKPRFGTRRCRGIWPPSNPRLNLKPDRDFAPLWPRPAVFPWPEPCPRPTLFFECLAPLGGFKSLRSIGITHPLGANHLYQVSHFVNHPANRGCVRQLHGVPNPQEAEAPNHRELIPLETDRALHQRDFDR